ncbi:uncharacterized protein LOC110722615 [Chenopodium quinoa]|uniref:uncharacterized protein LOC110722615 n=1 Tax=Chenopodium quinoa TaxID=63459 RepID=UPI000B7911EA|nr:uncharacterized protein LOC110722615 [Chenopodium quinoa]
MTCSKCNKKGHNKRGCQEKDYEAIAPPAKKAKGRPKGPAATPVLTQQSQLASSSTPATGPTAIGTSAHHNTSAQPSQLGRVEGSFSLVRGLEVCLRPLLDPNLQLREEGGAEEGELQREALNLVRHQFQDKGEEGLGVKGEQSQQLELVSCLVMMETQWFQQQGQGRDLYLTYDASVFVQPESLMELKSFLWFIPES